MGWRITLEWSSKGGGDRFDFLNVFTQIKKNIDIKTFYTKAVACSATDIRIIRGI